ncbi:MAG: T9SS type A sorting domain-containing protein [Candidatus Delongbacteria bacterium]|nr:T9SS type A sorting domain-containing protein [Candidatus Delongbacteria bacterium]
MQQWYDEEFGPTGTVSGGVYAGKSYWLCTENWGSIYQNPSQNYPIDLDVYYNSGGFSNGYVPLFIVVGFQNKVYWDNNSSNFRASLRQAIDEMQAEGVYVDKPVSDEKLIFDESQDFDLSRVFVDIEGNPVTVTLENNSDPGIVTAVLNGDILTITANNTTSGTSTITIKGTAGEFFDTDEFTISVFDPALYNIENFETGDFNKFPWKFSGTKNWIITTSSPYEGSNCIRSADINGNQSAETYLNMDYPSDGFIYFWYKVSSEGNYDFFKFYIDGIEKTRVSGSSTWIYATYPVSAGSHTFKWRYDKDISGDSGSDCAWVDLITFEGGMPTSINNTEARIQKLELYQNYPNPFNPATDISFSLNKSGPVKLSVYNHTGQLVSDLVDGTLSEGMHKINFNALDLNSGIYFYTLETSENSISRKMMLIK